MYTHVVKDQVEVLVIFSLDNVQQRDDVGVITKLLANKHLKMLARGTLSMCGPLEDT